MGLSLNRFDLGWCTFTLIPLLLLRSKLFFLLPRFLKNIQQATRYLQSVCQHSKTKDVSLSNHVPALKKSLETFVFRVKVTLALNKAGSCFWMGTLKNRSVKKTFCGLFLMSFLACMYFWHSPRLKLTT